MTGQSFLFSIFSTSMLLTAFLTVSAQNSIAALISLVLTFLAFSCLLFTLELPFFGLLFIIVYVGAIAVLFLFAVMLFSLKSVVQKKNRLYFLFGLFGLFWLVFAGFFFTHGVEDVPTYSTEYIPCNRSNWDGIMYYYDRNCMCLECQRMRPWILQRLFLMEGFLSVNELQALGLVLYDQFALHLVLISMLLLISMVIAVITINSARDRMPQAQSASKQNLREPRVTIVSKSDPTNTRSTKIN